MNPRLPTPKELGVVLPIALPLVILAVFVLRGCGTAKVPLVHPPEGFAAEGPSTTQPGTDLTGVQLAPVDGTTVPAGVRAGGTARLAGTVSGPQGPVAGATVRVEHLVAGSPRGIDALTDAGGHWNVSNIAGGRYRVRAFLVPMLAQLEPQVFFLEDGTEQTFDLTVESVSGLEVTSSIAPDPPSLDRPFTLVVRVARRAVDADGVVRGQPIQNANVVLTGAQGFNATSSTSAFTDGNGDASFNLECKTANSSQIQISVRATATEQPQPQTLQLNPCVDPKATTTSTAPSSASSTSSSSSPAPN